MGFNHVTAVSLYEYGAPGRMPYEQWPVHLAMSTRPAGEGGYSPDSTWTGCSCLLRRCTDSAAASTAMSAGVKTHNGVLGLDSKGRRVDHLLDRLEDRGMATGLVTSVQFAHATPAGFCVHNSSRMNYEEIAREMLLDSRVDVIMGCGHPHYDRDGRELAGARSYRYVGGESVWKGLTHSATEFDTDGDGTTDTRVRDADGDGDPDPWTLVEERSEFRALAQGPTPRRVLGIPRVADTLQYERSGEPHERPFLNPALEDVPTLAEMTRAALNVLDQSDAGFFLLVEGGAIDWASHDNDLERMLEELVAFDDAVTAAAQWVERASDWRETLVIVTADHECGGLWGPGSGAAGVWQPPLGRGAGSKPLAVWLSKSHTSVLVPFYAIGCGADVFFGAVEGEDPLYGAYLDNTALPRALRSLWQSAPPAGFGTPAYR
jgi:alkaline phosphatase